MQSIIAVNNLFDVNITFIGMETGNKIQQIIHTICSTTLNTAIKAFKFPINIQSNYCHTCFREITSYTIGFPRDNYLLTVLPNALLIEE